MRYRARNRYRSEKHRVAIAGFKGKGGGWRVDGGWTRLPTLPRRYSNPCSLQISTKPSLSSDGKYLRFVFDKPQINFDLITPSLPQKVEEQIKQ